MFKKNHLFSTIYKSSFRFMCSGEDVIFETSKNAGIITLNRPKALNALNLSMVQKIYPKLQEWEKEKGLVIVKGAGGKAFCAGGDARAVTEAGRKGVDHGKRFFKSGYTLNGLIGSYKIPYVALIDGIIMGGGAGVSMHGLFRIATERTVFAMPETAIGLFPDAGMTYFLPRLKGSLGLYLGLTGQRLKAIDVLHAGVATHYIKSENLPDLQTNLTSCKNETDINNLLKKYSDGDNTEFSLKPHLGTINECFNGKTMEDIFGKLEKNGSKWATGTLKTLKKMSPTSLKITLKAIQGGAKKNLLECLEVEFRLACACLANKDLYEGVRAILIDKDENPKWNPALIEEVTDEIVNSYFTKITTDFKLGQKT